MIFSILIGRRHKFWWQKPPISCNRPVLPLRAQGENSPSGSSTHSIEQWPMVKERDGHIIGDTRAEGIKVGAMREVKRECSKQIAGGRFCPRAPMWKPWRNVDKGQALEHWSHTSLFPSPQPTSQDINVCCLPGLLLQALYRICHNSLLSCHPLLCLSHVV